MTCEINEACKTILWFISRKFYISVLVAPLKMICRWTYDFKPQVLHHMLFIALYKFYNNHHHHHHHYNLIHKLYQIQQYNVFTSLMKDEKYIFKI